MSLVALDSLQVTVYRRRANELTRVNRGYGCCIVMPDDVAMDKVLVLEKLGASVERVRPGELPLSLDDEEPG